MQGEPTWRKYPVAILFKANKVNRPQLGAGSKRLQVPRELILRQGGRDTACLRQFLAHAHQGGLQQFPFSNTLCQKIPNLGQDIWFAAPENIAKASGNRTHRSPGLPKKRRAMTTEPHALHGRIRIQYGFPRQAAKCRRRKLKPDAISSNLSLAP